MHAFSASGLSPDTDGSSNDTRHEARAEPGGVERERGGLRGGRRGGGRAGAGGGDGGAAGGHLGGVERAEGLDLEGLGGGVYLEARTCVSRGR
jgi:hypothetical protein